MTIRATVSRVILGVAFVFAVLIVLRQSARVDMGINNVRALLGTPTNPFCDSDGCNDHS